MKKSISEIAALTFLATAACYYIIKNFGNVFFEFDSAAHFIAGMFAGSFGMAVLIFLWPKHTSAKKLIFCSATSAFLIGSLWEIWQQYILLNNNPISNTILDLIMDVAGGWLIAFSYTHYANVKGKRKRRSK